MFLLIILRPLISTLFPYMTLFRSVPRTACPPNVSSMFLHLRPTGISVEREEVSGWRRSSVAKRSEEHTSELQSRRDLVCRLLLEKKSQRRRSAQDRHIHGSRAGVA